MNFWPVPEAQPFELSGPGCTMSRGSDRQHSRHLPLLPGFLPSTPTRSCYQLAEALARHMFQKKIPLRPQCVQIAKAHTVHALLDTWNMWPDHHHRSHCLRTITDKRTRRKQWVQVISFNLVAKIRAKRLRWVGHGPWIVPRGEESNLVRRVATYNQPAVYPN